MKNHKRPLFALWPAAVLPLLYLYTHSHTLWKNDLHLQISWPYFIACLLTSQTWRVCVCVLAVKFYRDICVPLCDRVTIHLLPFFLQAVPRLGRLPQRWLAELKEYYQENSFAYITGLSANQSALSKHSNPNRAPGLGDWWVTHSTGAPATHEPPFSTFPSHTGLTLIGSDWLYKTQHWLFDYITYGHAWIGAPCCIYQNPSGHQISRLLQGHIERKKKEWVAVIVMTPGNM